jgi:hypothetical protein
MDAPDNFEIEEGCAVYRPVAHVSVAQGTQIMASAITFAREHHIRNLLINATGLTGFTPPGPVIRYQAVKEWAQAAAGAVRIAVVHRAEMIDPHKFGVQVAKHIGLIGEVFTSEPEALAWLRSLA